MLLCVALVLKRTELRLEGTLIKYVSVAHRWQIDLSTVESVDVPSNYRLLYLTIQVDSSQRHRLPILSFGTPRSVASALLDIVPRGRTSSHALHTLEAIARGQRADQVIRWRDETE
jgi:hypothetical protein